MSRLQTCCLLMAALAPIAGACDSEGDQELSRRIGRAANAADVTTVRLTDLTPFSWDRLFVFGPYTPAETVERELGFGWWWSDKIEMYDQFALVVFVKDRRVVRFIEHGRDHGDLAYCGRPGGYAPAQAIFRFRKDEAGFARCLPDEKSDPILKSRQRLDHR